MHPLLYYNLLQEHLFLRYRVIVCCSLLFHTHIVSAAPKKNVAPLMHFLLAGKDHPITAAPAKKSAIYASAGAYRIQLLLA